MAQGVKRGEGIAAPVRKAGVFPPLAAHLLIGGRRNRQAGSDVRPHGGDLRDDTRAAIKRFTAIFEPLVILVMGVMVGALILSMLLAITSINDVAV